MPQFPSPPPPGAGGGVSLETGVCKRWVESVLGPVHTAASCVSAERAREIAKHLLSRTESLFLLLYLLSPSPGTHFNCGNSLSPPKPPVARL